MTAMIRVSHVAKRFGGRSVLRDLSFELAPGSTVALMGPNGSGKSTAMSLVLGLLDPDSGTIEGVRGRAGVADVTFAAVFQEDRLCEQLSAVGNLRVTLPRRTPDAGIVEELRHAGLTEEAMTLPMAALSGGQRRRVCIARAMSAPADVVCLDEPFRGIYRPDRVDVMRYLRDRLGDRPALLITHDVEEARWFGGTIVPFPA